MAPAARCPCTEVRAWGRGAALRPTVCPLGQPLPGQAGPTGHPSPQNARSGVPAAGRAPRGLCPPSSGGPSSSSQMSEAPWPLCEVLQAEQADFLVRTYRKDRGPGPVDQELDPSVPQPPPERSHTERPCPGWPGPAAQGTALQVPAARMCRSRWWGKNTPFLAFLAAPLFPGRGGGLLPWKPAPSPSNSPLR